MDMNQAAQAPVDGQGQAPQGEGDVSKLIQGVGMGLQKLSEVLPPEIAPKVAELMSEFQAILSGQESEEPEGEEMPAQGAADMMSAGRGKPMM